MSLTSPIGCSIHLLRDGSCEIFYVGGGLVTSGPTLNKIAVTLLRIEMVILKSIKIVMKFNVFLATVIYIPHWNPAPNFCLGLFKMRHVRTGSFISNREISFFPTFSF